MRRILFSLVLLGSAGIAWAQDTPAPATNSGSGITCTQRLRLARATYEAGRLHELVGTILGDQATGCFNPNNENAFSKQEKVDALKLMVLAYIYLEEPAKADDKMKQLLETDHFYKIDENSDPAEYIALYRTFRTTPILSLTLKGGANLNLPTILKVYPVSTESTAEYKPGVSYQVGLSVEREFFPKSKIAFLKKTELMGEMFYFSRAYRMENNSMFFNIPTPDVVATTSTYKSNTVWLDLNVLLKYHLNADLNIDPYVAIGPSFSYLLTAQYDLLQTQHLKEDGETIFNTVVGPAVDVKQTHLSFTNSAIAAGGIKLRLGDVYLNAEARMQFGFLNLVNDKKRFTEEIQTDYGININDYRQTNFTLNIGVTVPIYKPKKLTRKK